VRHNTCKCGYVFNSSKVFEYDARYYLVDANIFIYAIRNNPYRGAHCKKILEGSHPVATTKRVLNEVKNKHDYKIRVFNVKEISPEVDELKYNGTKELSDADKSLIQCAINQPNIDGIITNDMDIKSVCPQSMIKSEKKFFIGRPYEYLKMRGCV